MSFKCPDCHTPLKKVLRSADSPLNRDQFDAAKAGDYYCDKCPSNGRGNTSFRYFWLHEVLHTCDHETFSANVDVHRLIDSGHFQADVRIECKECGKSFSFIGLPSGVNLNGAATNPDATEVRLAIAPFDEVTTVIDGTPAGFSIRKE